ncbi:ATP adenylyltransferase-domain-containing protein [Scenedesmus sp. NREL 46B-D3]|nr:ATP adenylyltransferase-domain-containing protein [Scenedesmus sp. NREL 46B-D3]
MQQMQALISSGRMHSLPVARPAMIYTAHNRKNTHCSAVAHSTSAMPAQQCSALWSKVLQVYDAAQASGAATKADTKVHTYRDGNVEFVLRIASALKSKPKGLSGSAGSAATPNKQQQQQGPPAGFRNPFLPYEEALWVQHLSGSHTLLLNKFNVVPHHVLVVTREFESQQEPLNARDLAATQQVLDAMPRGGVAFYNCGEHSGRSQPHKHLQIVPLPFQEDQASQQQQQQPQQTSAAQMPVQQLISAAQAAAGAQPLQPFPVRQAPFRAYAAVLGQSATAEQLEAAAGQLLAHCQAGLPAPVSYNVILTQQLLLMVPRKQESCGRIAVNSLGFAGTILLRSEEDLQFAQQQGPMSMLAEVGQPWSSEPAE